MELREKILTGQEIRRMVLREIWTENRLLQTEKAVLAAREVRADRIPHRNPTMLSPAFLKIKRKATRPTLPPERMKVQFL